MIRRLTVLVVLLLAVGCSQPAAPPPTVTSAHAANFREVACGEGALPNMTCGMLTVPENRTTAESTTIELPVMIFAATGDNVQPDPVIHLAGGPGADLLSSVDFYLQRGGRQLMQQRDYILFNQRGTALTTHHLNCPAYNQLRFELAAASLPDSEQDTRITETLSTCRAMWGEADLTAYNSAENAADIEALRLALGYEQVNLYGISYGTRLALTMMRDYPGSVRSVILDSVFPPQADLFSDVASNAYRSFSRVFEECDCAENFYAAYDALEAEPVQVPVRGYDVQVDGDLFVETLFVMLYRADLIPTVSQVIISVEQGSTFVLANYLPLALDRQGISVGMYYSVQCSEEIPFDSYQVAQEKAADLPAPFAAHFVDSFDYDLCDDWPTTDLPPLEDEPVHSDIPTLLLSGGYDPITPPAWGALAAETLPNSYHMVFDELSHGVIRSNQCALALALDFLADPSTAPEAPCYE